MHHRIFSHRQRRFAFGLLIACRLLRERGGGMSSSSSRAACHAVNEQQEDASIFTRLTLNIYANAQINF